MAMATRSSTRSRRQGNPAAGSRLFPYALSAPTFVVIVGIVLVPLLTVFYLSLTDARFVTDGQFIGLENFAHLTGTDPYFWGAVRNTVVWAGGIVTAEFVLGLGIALLLNQRVRFRGVFRGVVLLPWVMPTVTASLVWMTLYADDGVFNDVLGALGLPAVAWLSDTRVALGAVMLVVVWKTLPFVVVALLAGLQAIPEELYEAAQIDGAGRFQQFRSITLPILWPVASLVIVLNLIWRVGDFDAIFLMTGGGPANSTQLIATYAYQQTTSGLEAARGAAVAVFAVLLLLVLVPYFVKRVVKED